MNWPAYRWANGYQAVKHMISLSWVVPIGLGPGSHLPWGQAPCPWVSMQASMSMYISPKVGCQISQVAATEDPITSYSSMASLGKTPVTNVGLLCTASSSTGLMQFPQTLAEGMGASGWTAVASFPRWSNRHVCLLGGCGLVFATGHWHGPPWVGMAALAVAATAMGVLWDMLCWHGQAHLQPIGWHSGHEYLCLCKWDQWLHCPLEFQHTFCQTVRLTRNQQLGLLSPILKCPCVGEGMVWLGESVVLTAKPCIWGWHKMILPNGWVCLQRGVIIVHPFAQLCVFGTSNKAHTFQENSWQSSCLGSSEVSSIKVASGHVWHATISSPIGTGERTLDLWALTLAGLAGHLLPQHQLGMALPYPGAPGGGASVAGDTPDLHLLWLPPASTNCPFHVVPSQSATFVGAAGGPHPLWHHIPDSLPSMRVPSLHQRSPDASGWWD